MRIILILIVKGRYAVLDAKSPMQRLFWWGLGVGVCATSLIQQYNDTVISQTPLLACFLTICALRIMNLAGSIDDKLEDVIHILLEEEDEEIYHPPYDIELPEDES